MNVFFKDKGEVKPTRNSLNSLYAVVITSFTFELVYPNFDRFFLTVVVLFYQLVNLSVIAL